MNNLVLLKKEMREKRWKFLIGLAIFLVSNITLPFLYDTIEKIINRNAMTPGMERFLGSLNTFDAYLWSQWAKTMNQYGAILAILLGMGAVSPEVSSRTIEFLLTKPVRRSQVFAKKIPGGLDYPGSGSDFFNAGYLPGGNFCRPRLYLR